MKTVAASTIAALFISWVAAGGQPAKRHRQEQAREHDRKRRQATLHRIQQLMHERTMFAPIWDIVTLHGYGPRVAEPGLGLVGSFIWSAPYEEVRLKTR